MCIRKRVFWQHLLSILLVILPTAEGYTAPRQNDDVISVHHNMSVTLTPATHELAATDQVDLEVNVQVKSVRFTLAQTLQVESITLGQESSSQVASFTTVQIPDSSAQRIVVMLPEEHSRKVTLVWVYRGLINDPPKEPRHLRFVTPSETAGHIGLEGVYLSGESQWYPDAEGSFSTYQVATHIPEGWTVVGSGQKVAENLTAGMVSSRWIVQERSEAFTLVANKFLTKSREWKASTTGQRVEIQTYLLSDNAELANEYLDATAQYLDAYIQILGAYPFEKFAVVENFFASGLGIPSFTLLGSGSIKRHYTQPYALGHEIVHSWIGNSVFNRDGHGNWVEGLTTYLANYYWHELVQDDRQALEQRRMMLQGYNLYVRPEGDYAVSQFFRKHDEKDNAIGYQKAAFVFHLLRREIGDEPFWRGLKTFVSQYRNQPADWESIEEVFSRESGQRLRWFFEQWVEQPGAPMVSLGDASARRVKNDGGQDIWQLTIRIQQSEKPYRITIPVRIVMEDTSEVRSVMLNPSRVNIVELVLPTAPLWVELDPEMMMFRRLARHQLPPVLNSYVTDSYKTVMRAFTDPASPLEQIVSRIEEHEPTDSQRTKVVALEGHVLPREGSVLILADADQGPAVQSVVLESCGDRAALKDTGFRIDGQSYEGPNMAVLFSCHRANVPGSVMTVLYGVTSDAVAKVARLLFYYGWHSYVIFQDGSVKKREIWPGQEDTMEVRIDGMS
ncbi:MAG: M1 family metallopeptidase [Nitrospira sp.]